MATRDQKLKAAYARRKKHIRKKVQGSEEKPRLLVVRSLKHVRATLVNDDQGISLTGVSDNKLPELELSEDATKVLEGLSGKTALAFKVGLAIASIAKEKGISKVVFDRNGRRYHGRVKAVAEGARKGGLEF